MSDSIEKSFVSKKHGGQNSKWPLKPKISVSMYHAQFLRCFYTKTCFSRWRRKFNMAKKDRQNPNESYFLMYLKKTKNLERDVFFGFFFA